MIVSRNQYHHDRRPCRSGMVLLVVTVLLLMISLAALGLVTWMQTEHQASRIRGDELRLENTAASGAEYLAALSKRTRKEQAEAGGMTSNTAVFRHRAVQFELRQPAETFFAVLPTDRFDYRSVAFGATNESAKFHLQALLEWDRKSPGVAQQALMQLPGMTFQLADRILDWIDSDSTPRMYGGEATIDSRSGGNRVGPASPAQPRDAVPATLDELLAIPGLSRERLFGGNKFVGDAASERERGRPRDQTEMIPWSNFLTVHSRERNETFTGEPRIHINQPDLATLHDEVDRRLGRVWADLIIAYRQFGPMRGRSGPPATDYKVELSLPAKFQFQSELDLVGLVVAVPAKGSLVKLLRSPLAADRVQGGGEFTAIMDNLSADPRKIIEGRINVDEASREVLLGIPGMDPVTADRIVASRSLTSDSPATRAHPAWLAEQGVVELSRLRKLLPFLTSGGDVWKANIVAYFADRPQMIHEEVVVDGTGSGLSQLYCRDKRDLRFPYPIEALVPAQ
jgi:Type II secretion system (T2SS), protein K